MTTDEVKKGPVDARGTVVLGPGARLGKYEIRRLVGVGSMGAVYEGTHTETGEAVAIKVLKPVLAAAPPARARFLNEAKLAARVRHPHIIAVTEVGEDGGHCYLVMEMLKGEDLARRLGGSAPLSAAETADIMLPVCHAVAEAHGRGITHRDLKPSNIFLTVRDDRPRPIVLDFGIAQDEELGRARQAGSAPRPGEVLGTPYYLAPELVADHRAAGPSSDQYALGVILYECLTGQPPFRGDRVEDVLEAIVAGSPTPPRTLHLDVPAELEAVVLRAMSADPAARFPSVAELGRALVPFASNPGDPARAARRPTPLSPAIEVEATTPSPFVRTLTPEVESLSDPWFAAPEPSGEFAIEAPTGPPNPLMWADPETYDDRNLAVGRSQSLATVVNSLWALASRRRWVGATTGVALALVTVTWVATRGGSSKHGRPETPSVAIVAPLPIPAANPTPPPPPPASEPPAVAAAAPPAPTAPPGPTAATAPTASDPPVAVASPPPAPPADDPPAPPAQRADDPRVAEAIAPPAEVPPAGVAAAREAPRARKPPAKPRVRANPEVRMHNGVPLLD